MGSFSPIRSPIRSPVSSGVPGQSGSLFGFDFTDVTGALVSTVYTSNTIVVTGATGGVVVSITGGTYSKNGGAYTSSAGTVGIGDTFSVRATSSSAVSTAVNVVLTLGLVSGTYTITTEAALPTLAALTTTAPRAVYCHTARLVSGYAGNLCQVTIGGVTHDVPMNAAGKIDINDLTTWWLSQGGTYQNGPFPRLSIIYNQTTATTSNMVQATEAQMPILDMNNYKSDGFLPASLNGYSAPENNTSGSAYSPLETNLNMASGAGTTASNTGNHSIAYVCGSVDNVGTAAAGSPSQNALFGMDNATAANRVTFQAGDTDWTQRFGFGWLFNATKTFPPSAVRARMNRQCIVTAHTTNTSTTLDGVGPGTPLSNFRVNGVQAESYTVGTARASSAISTTGFLKIGRTAAGTAATGTAQELYAMILYDNSLVTAGVTPNDQRATVENSLISIFNIRTSYSYQFASIGSSSIAGYKSNSGLGIIAYLATLLNDVAISVETYAVAGTSLITAQEPNKVFISSMKRSGMTKTFFHLLNARNDLTTGGATGLQVYTAAISMMAQANTDTWTVPVLSTLFTSITAGAVSQPTFDAERADFNARVLAGGVANSYTPTDPAGIAQLSNYNDYTYFDDQIHTRGGSTYGGSPLISAQLNTLVRANI